MDKVMEDLLTISDICRGWDTDNIEHLAGVLKLPDDQRSIANIEKEIKWLFHSKTIAKGKVAAKSIWSKVYRYCRELSYRGSIQYANHTKSYLAAC